MVTLSDKETLREAEALAFAKANRREIARKATNTSIFKPEKNPVSVFMAGSPGAGKTEASIALLEGLGGDSEILRIDPDTLRKEFKHYDGSNSYLFQRGVSILVEKIHDLALKNSQSFLLDGTLSKYAKASDNIERSLKKGRLVRILYVYQNPLLAWAFVVAREAAEGRRILPETFIEQYFAARKTVNRLKGHFGKQIEVDLLIKNIDNSNRVYKGNVDKIDNHIPEEYSAESISAVITPVSGE